MSCWAVIPEHDLPDKSARTFAELPGLTFSSDSGVFSLPDDGESLRVWTCRTSCDPKAAEIALARIADDALRVRWVAESSGEVYAPYDGGIDVIASTVSVARCCD